MNRRMFLGCGAAGVLKADVLPGSRVGLGVIGAGWMGLPTMKVFMNDPRVQVVAVRDVDADHLKEASAEAPMPAHSTNSRVAGASGHRRNLCRDPRSLALAQSR